MTSKSTEIIPRPLHRCRVASEFTVDVANDKPAHFFHAKPGNLAKDSLHFLDCLPIAALTPLSSESHVFL
jgi:hypothetical protein